MLPIDPLPLPEPPGAGDICDRDLGDEHQDPRGSAGGGHALFSDSAGDSEPGKARRTFHGISVSEDIGDLVEQSITYRYFTEVAEW